MNIKTFQPKSLFCFVALENKGSPEQKVGFTKVANAGHELEKTAMPDYLTCPLIFLFNLHNTQKCGERKGKYTWIA